MVWPRREQTSHFLIGPRERRTLAETILREDRNGDGAVTAREIVRHHRWMMLTLLSAMVFEGGVESATRFSFRFLVDDVIAGQNEFELLILLGLFAAAAVGSATTAAASAAAVPTGELLLFDRSATPYRVTVRDTRRRRLRSTARQRVRHAGSSAARPPRTPGSPGAGMGADSRPAPDRALPAHRGCPTAS